MKVGDMVKLEAREWLGAASAGIIVRASWQEPPKPKSTGDYWHCNVLWSDGSITCEDAFYLETIDETN